MSMAIKYAMKKKAKAMASGGVSCEPKMMAEGGKVDDDDDDMVGRIMKKRSGEPVADFESDDFDATDEIPEDHAADYTGENSGDELGNGREDKDDKDMVGRIMRKRSKSA